MKKSILIIAFGILVSSVSAQNPIVQTHYTPDPAPMVHGDKVYVYTGEDVPGFDFYYMTKWRVYSSEDMVNWTDHGAPLTLEDFSWAVDRAWASQCIERDGKFYWYICAQTDQNDMGIGVAVSDSPTGPFKDAIGKPLIANGSWSHIDPSPYIDDDGQAYLYWGNAHLYYVKLNEDMISYSGDIIEVPQSVASFGGVRRPRNQEGDRQEDPPVEANKDVFIEGPWFYKRNGIYYQLFAGMEKGKECLSYSISDSPTGPWQYQGRVMVDQPTNSFTNHGGVVDFKDKSYLFYHTALLPGGGSYGRSTAVEEFEYETDGKIPNIQISDGPGPIATINPYERVEAETIAWAEKCSTREDEKVGVYVSDIRKDGFIKVRAVDFGDTAPSTFSASLAAGLQGGVLEVYADSVGGIKLASIDVPRTGGWQEWKTIQTEIENPVRGVKDLYFSFKTHNLTAGRRLFNFDYWMFEK